MPENRIVIVVRSGVVVNVLADDPMVTVDLIDFDDLEADDLDVGRSTSARSEAEARLAALQDEMIELF